MSEKTNEKMLDQLIDKARKSLKAMEDLKNNHKSDIHDQVLQASLYQVRSLWNSPEYSEIETYLKSKGYN